MSDENESRKTESPERQSQALSDMWALSFHDIARVESRPFRDGAAHVRVEVEYLDGRVEDETWSQEKCVAFMSWSNRK